MPYDHEIFISYSHDDEPWASKLETDLLSSGVKNVFRDHQLLPGETWEDKILTKVRTSQHMVVLWSTNAASSDWVRRERSNFDTMITPVTQGEVVRDRLLIFVRLDEEELAYTSLQVFPQIKEAKVYPGSSKGVDPKDWEALIKKSVDDLDPLVWQTIVNKIVTAVQSKDDSTPVPTAILAAKKPEIEALGAATLDSLVKDLGLASREELCDRYGPRRFDWKPFGSIQNIEMILANQQNAINKVTDNPKFRWEFISDSFWTDMDAARSYADTLRERLSLIIIDPVSLNVQLIQRRANMLKKCLANSETAVMIPMPFTLSEPLLKLRKLIKDEGAPLFDEYFNPPVHDLALIPPVASVGIYIGDEDDTKRLLLATLAPYVRKLAATGSPYTKQK